MRRTAALHFGTLSPACALCPLRWISHQYDIDREWKMAIEKRHSRAFVSRRYRQNVAKFSVYVWDF